MDLSVVIPTHNQADLLAECLWSFTNQTLPAAAYEIIVVDDGSTDQTQIVLNQYAKSQPLLTVIRFPSNRGRSAARNAGIARASAPIVVFVDSDIIVRKDFLQWHRQTHRQHGPGILSRGPVVLTSDARLGREGPTPWILSSPAYLDTANAAVPQTALLQAGLFDEAFPGYGWEDFELGLRLHRLGIRRVFCRQAVAFHVQPPMQADSVASLLRKEEERAKSAVYFYHKHPTLQTRILIQATVLHRALYWLQAAGGILSPRNIITITNTMRHKGFHSLAFLGLRGVLNLHYIRKLAMELRRDGTVQN